MENNMKNKDKITNMKTDISRYKIGQYKGESI